MNFFNDMENRLHGRIKIDKSDFPLIDQWRRSTEVLLCIRRTWKSLPHVTVLWGVYNWNALRFIAAALNSCKHSKAWSDAKHKQIYFCSFWMEKAIIKDCFGLPRKWVNPLTKTGAIVNNWIRRGTDLTNDLHVRSVGERYTQSEFLLWRARDTFSSLAENRLDRKCFADHDHRWRICLQVKPLLLLHVDCQRNDCFSRRRDYWDCDAVQRLTLPSFLFELRVLRCITLNQLRECASRFVAGACIEWSRTADVDAANLTKIHFAAA